MKLGFLSIDIGTILFSWINLMILFFALKRFLFKPVQKILTERQAAVDQALNDADEARARAEAAETEYTEKLTQAKEESAEILRNATRKAQQRSEEIVANARNEAAGIMQHNRDELEREKRRAESQLRSDVSELAVLVAEKVVGREINQTDHARLIDEFIESVGDVQ